MGIEIAQADRVLTDGQLSIEGRLTGASNTTLLATVTLAGQTIRCVYKPIRGERPLWDFPDGSLAHREVGAYLVSQATGWDLVPPTVLRDGPLGPGACQLWVETEPDDDLAALVPSDQVPDGYLPVLSATLVSGEEVVLAHRDDERLAHMAVFDAVVNNADRKVGHLLLAADEHLFGCDHGVCFHVEDKLRTVLWGFAGRELDEEATVVIDALDTELAGSLGARLTEHLSTAEVARTRSRVRRLRRTGRYPGPGRGWPAVPWPPF
ncbi:MAG: SCO1664 family protein [Actinomycetes bacterium]